MLEVFEWKSKAAIEAAHTNPRVLEMWNEYADVCDYAPVNTVEETSDLFAEFEPYGEGLGGPLRFSSLRLGFDAPAYFIGPSGMPAP